MKLIALLLGGAAGASVILSDAVQAIPLQAGMSDDARWILGGVGGTLIVVGGFLGKLLWRAAGALDVTNARLETTNARLADINLAIAGLPGALKVHEIEIVRQVGDSIKGELRAASGQIAREVDALRDEVADLRGDLGHRLSSHGRELDEMRLELVRAGIAAEPPPAPLPVATVRAPQRSQPDYPPPSSTAQGGHGVSGARPALRSNPGRG